MVLAKNLPQSTKIQHHAVTLPPNCWTWMEVGHLAQCKVSQSGLYIIEPIKIQQNRPLQFDGYGVVKWLMY